jgi:hypothetical protein
MTLPVQLDEAVKVTATPLTLVPLEVTAVQSFPTESPAGDLTRNTSAHWLPSPEELLLVLADGLVEAVGLLDTVVLIVGLGLAEALAVVLVDGVEVAAEATATPTPIAASRTVDTTAPLTRVRLRMVFPFRISCWTRRFRNPWLDDGSPWWRFLGIGCQQAMRRS